MSDTSTETDLSEQVASLWSTNEALLWIVTSAHAKRSGGLIATFVMQASIVPECPRVLVGIGKRHHTHDLIQNSRAFAVHLFGPEQIDWCWRFALAHGFEHDKLAGLGISTGMTGAPLLDEATAYLECRVEAEYDTGDRTLFLGEVVSARHHPNRSILRAGALFAAANPDQRRQLAEDFTRDSALDREAIERWRLQQSPAPPSL